MSANTTAIQRPTAVTTVVVLAWVGALLDIVSGAGLIALAGNDAVVNSLNATTDVVRILGVGLIITGTVGVLVAWFLGRGSNAARVLASVVMVTRIVGSAYGVFALGTHHLSEGISQIFIAVAVLNLLWRASSNEYFTRR